MDRKKKKQGSNMNSENKTLEVRNKNLYLFYSMLAGLIVMIMGLYGMLHSTGLIFFTALIIVLLGAYIIWKC